MPPLREMASPLIKGWCPTAYRPMESGDGLIIRAHTPRGRLSLQQLRAAAHISRVYGNALVDLTQRAQIQIRGLSAKTHGPAMSELADADLLAADACGDRLPHILAWPLAGLAPCNGVDADAFASTLSARLMKSEALCDLPPKFLFIVEGGDAAQLPEIEADIRFTPTSDGQIAIRLGGAAGCAAFVEPMAGIDAGCTLALAFLEYCRADARAPRRMKHLVETIGATRIFGAASLTPVVTPPVLSRSADADFYGATKIGALSLVGVGAPSGRLAAEVIEALANCAESLGATEARLTPWRMALFSVTNPANAAALVETACAMGLITSRDDPRRAVVACPGGPECSQARGATRLHLAQLGQLAARLAGADGVGLHVSGCQKGCARPLAAPVTLVATGDGFDLIENGRAGDSPVRLRLTINEVESALLALAEDRPSCPRP